MKGGVSKQLASGVAPRVLVRASHAESSNVGFERHTANKFNGAAWTSFIGATFGKGASIDSACALQQSEARKHQASPMPICVG
ncbi:hypothetical protein QCE62_30030 [Caballeronia sp. LZ033]|uniref:hypothetical protein n=1 Tax=Caballeronia sp. LZ033 TaxID=3038566 RepID=UPI0028641B52|nr:hypothetical protein [Caballeronia sp. LZ033]MDR5817857.1 hypothetical protein [Caballeronia sp. LZ033]